MSTEHTPGHTPIPTPTLKKWRSLTENTSMVSALGEYTPEEFCTALDEIDRLKVINEELTEMLQNVLAFLDEEANTQNEGAKAWPVLQRIQGSAIFCNARAALAKASRRAE